MIAQVVAGNVLYSLQEGQAVPITTGDTLKVAFAFKYKMPEQSSVQVWASLYRYTAGILDRASDAQTKGTILLEQSLEWKDYSGEIDILIPQISGTLGGIISGGINAGLWGLIVELPDYNIEEHIDNCLEATAAAGIFDMIGPLLMIGLMVGLMSMFGGEKEGGLSG